MILGLVSLAFLLIFSLLYVSKGIEKKPEAMTKAVDKILANLDMLAFLGTIYGLVAAILAPILLNYIPFLFVSLLANVTIIVMALPYAFEKLTSGYEEKINAAMMESLRGMMSTVTNNDKIIGYSGSAIAFLLFAVMFS